MNERTAKMIARVAVPLALVAGFVWVISAAVDEPFLLMFVSLIRTLLIVAGGILAVATASALLHWAFSDTSWAEIRNDLWKWEK